MDDELKDYRRYLKFRLDEFNATPELCPNSIAAYKQYIQWLDESKSGEEFETKVKKDGHMFSIFKGEELDKKYALWILQKNFQHEKSSIAAELRYKAILATTDYTSLNKAITSTIKTAGDMDQLEKNIHDAILELFSVINSYIISEKKAKDNWMESIKLHWHKLVALDPEISWKKICSHPPYRRRLVLDNSRLTQIGKIIEAANG